MALQLDQIDDFVELTLNKFKRRKWTDISLEYTEYVSAKINSDKKVTERGGPQIEFTLQTKNTDTARNVGLYDQDQTNVEDLATKGTVPWRHDTVNWSYDIDEELFQSDRETIVSELVMREHACMSNLAELREENLWSAPSSSSDNKKPFGIPYWLQKDASTTPEGAFNGGNPSGFAAGCANVDSTAFPKWKNWTFGYTSVTPDDLVRKVKKSVYKTHFMAPHAHPEIGFGNSDYMIYTVYDVREPLERLAESRNDNLGRDVARYINEVTVAGIPLQAVPYLDANDSSDPLYGINWKVFRPYVKKGKNMRRTMKPAPLQRNVRQVHYDTAMNYVCYNRRLCWVGSKA